MCLEQTRAWIRNACSITVLTRAGISAERAAFSCDVLLVVGTSAVVYPAAGLVDLAQSSGAKVIEVNAETTTISRTVGCALTGPAGEILPKLINPAAESAGHGGI